MLSLKSCYWKHNASLRWLKLTIFSLVFLTHRLVFAQGNQVYFEASIKYKDGERFSTQITINFTPKVFDLAPGTVQATIADIVSNYPNLLTAFNALEQQYGKVIFQKQIPEAVWGDVWRLSRSTKKMVRITEWSQLFYIRFQDFVPIEPIMEQLQSLPEVAYVHGPIVARPDANPNDPKYQDGSQWNLEKIQANLGWDITKGNSNLRIGIVEAESGFPNINHPDFWTGTGTSGSSKFDIIPSGDGTYHASMVAGIVAATTNDNDGIASLGWNLIMNAYNFNSGSISYPSDRPGSLAYAMYHANQNCDVINCSFTIFKDTYTHHQDCGCDVFNPYSLNYYPSVDSAFSDAIAQEIVVIASMGNTGYNRIDNPEKPGCNPDDCETLVPFVAYPAAYNGVIGVTATDSDDAVPDNYNYNGAFDFIDLAAPGINVWSTNHANGYSLDSGSSFSVPLVAALAGLILSVNPNLNPNLVQEILENTVDVIDESYDMAGAGRINAYQSLLMALAYANKTPNISPTIYNNQRILARGQNSPATVLHEVFAAGVSESNEVFYRRSSNNGSGWDLTERLSAGAENNRLPCLAITDEGTPDGVHTVWQTKKANGKYKIYYRRSTNNGVSWGTPFLLADDVTCSSYQSAGPMPVITSIAYLSSYKLVVVWVSSTGLKYRTAYNNQWASTLSLNDSPDNDKVWFPSLMGKDNWTSLTYDTRNNVYSRVYNGVWSSRTLVDKTTTINDRASQIDITVGNSTTAVWYARPSAGGNYRICFRTGYSNNTWNSQYQEFYHTNLDALYPAVSVYNTPEDDCYAVVYNTADNQLRLQLKVTEAGTWTAYTPGSNNRFANITHTHLNTPKMIWTGNQNSTSGPYPIELSQQYMPKTTQANNWVYHRRADIENESNRTAFSIEWGGIEAVTKAGESLALEFIPCPKGTNLELNASNVMDYLATRPTTLSAAIEQLRFHYHVFTSCERDTLNNKIVTDFTDFAVTFRLTDQISKQNYAITKRYSDTNGAINDSQVLTVAVALPAGTSIVMKPEFRGTSIAGNQFSYSLGHIYLEQDGLLPKPVPSQLKTLAPETFALLQNFPNPFNGETEITYRLTQSAHITLRIFNLLGQELRTLVDREESAGLHTIRWDGKDAQAQELVSGIYIYQIEAGTFIACKKLALIR